MALTGSDHLHRTPRPRIFIAGLNLYP